MSKGWLVPLALMVAMQASPSWAQSSTAAAVQLFDEGRAALQEGDLNRACTKFEESNRIEPATGTAFNLANCEEQRGRLATAWVTFRQVASRMKPDDPRLAIANEHIAVLDRRVPHLILGASAHTPAGTRVRVDDLELVDGSFGSAIPLDPGPHRVLIRSPGVPARQSSITLTEGETLTLPLDAPEQAEPSKKRTGRFLGMTREEALWVSGGIGVTGLLVGSIAGVVGLNAQAVGDGNCSDLTRTCSPRGHDANQRAKTMATVSTVGFAVGVLGVGSAAYVYLAVPAGEPSRTASLGVRGQW